MKMNEPWGEVINLPVRPDTEPSTTDSAPQPDPDGDPEVLEGRVLVDRPETHRPDLRSKMLDGQRAKKLPIIAPWLRDPGEAKATARWAVSYAGHVTAYHAVRVPLYGVRLTRRSPRGAVRVVVATWQWAFDAEAMPLRTYAADRGDADTYLRLLRERDARVRWRWIVAGAGAMGAGLGASAVVAAGGIVQATAAAVLVTVLGWIGTPEDKRILDTAVVSAKAPKLTSEIVARALASVGIAEINKAMGKGGSGITFPAPITRDGPGWRADVDLPYGVTATDIMDRRDKLASGLRRPLGCVWPEPAHDQHAGRLVLWVGDQDMNQVKPPAWPLTKSGSADVFKPIAFGTDQRKRPVTITLVFASVLIGAMPRIGKTFSIKPLLLASGLDVTVESLVFELKGTGDLDFSRKYAHRYGSGPDDQTIAECLDALRYVHGDIERRAKVIRSLPKDVCPENKVTPQLAAKTSLGLHPLHFYVDECQELFAHPSYGKEAGELATAIIKRGPAMGVSLILATQRPDKDSLPTGISANVGIRFCLRVMGQVENDMVLGTSAYSNGIRATTFTRNDKGIGYLVGEADDPQIVRTYYVDRHTADRVADRARAARKAAGRLAGYAAGEDTIPTDDRQVSLLADVAAVLAPGEDKVWSETVIARLAELRPGLYTGWSPAQLADALKPYGIATGQVWGQDETGRSANRRGITCEHVRTALDAMRPDTAR